MDSELPMLLRFLLLLSPSRLASNLETKGGVDVNVRLNSEEMAEAIND